MLGYRSGDFDLVDSLAPALFYTLRGALCMTENVHFYAHLITTLACANVNFALFDRPYPGCHSAIEQCIKHNRNGSIMFRRIPAEVVVPAEARGAQRKCRVSEGKADIGIAVRLLELQ